MLSSGYPRLLARAFLFVTVGIATGCSNTVISSPAETRAVRNVAILSLDGDVQVGFEDEPGQVHGIAKIRSSARPMPAAGVTPRRAREAEAVFSAARDAFARGPGWTLVRPTPVPSWTAAFAARAFSAASDDSPRMIHLGGLPYARLIEEDENVGAGSRVLRAPLGDVASQLGVQAFALVTFEVARHGLTSHGPILTPQPESAAADGRLAPVVRVRVLIVDPQGRVLDRVEAQAGARTCGLPLATENSEDEVCPVVEATAAATELAVRQIVN